MRTIQNVYACVFMWISPSSLQCKEFCSFACNAGKNKGEIHTNTGHEKKWALLSKTYWRIYWCACVSVCVCLCVCVCVCSYEFRLSLCTWRSFSRKWATCARFFLCYFSCCNAGKNTGQIHMNTSHGTKISTHIEKILAHLLVCVCVCVCVCVWECCVCVCACVCVCTFIWKCVHMNFACVHMLFALVLATQVRIRANFI